MKWFLNLLLILLLTGCSESESSSPEAENGPFFAAWVYHLDTMDIPPEVAALASERINLIFISIDTTRLPKGEYPSDTYIEKVIELIT